jgi:hypothetical protein
MDIQQLLDDFDKDPHIASTSFYAWKHINNIVASDPAVAGALSRNGTTWGIILHSLQVTFLIAMGRIFDRDNRSFTVHHFIGECKANVSEFSRAALEQRRVAQNKGVRPEYLDDLLARAYEPTASDFDDLDAVAVKYRKQFEKVYQPIRHKVIAHRNRNTMGSTDTLFAQTNIGEVQNFLTFLSRLHLIASALYHDGRRTAWADHNPDYEVRIGRDLNSILQRLAAPPAPGIPIR